MSGFRHGGQYHYCTYTTFMACHACSVLVTAAPVTKSLRTAVMHPWNERSVSGFWRR